MAPLSFLEFDIPQGVMLAYLVRFFRIRARMPSWAMVSVASQIFFLEI
jgi:hypothetical protein